LLLSRGKSKKTIENKGANMSFANSETHGKIEVNTVIAEDLISSDKGYAQGPERALMAALLFDAVQAYICYIMLDPEKQTKSRYKEAFHWVHSIGSEYVFSFESVCEGLGIEPDFLRLGLINVIKSREDWKRARRNF
jgi:hypothetical protein